MLLGQTMADMFKRIFFKMKKRSFGGNAVATRELDLDQKRKRMGRGQGGGARKFSCVYFSPTDKTKF